MAPRGGEFFILCLSTSILLLTLVVLGTSSAYALEWEEPVKISDNDDYRVEDIATHGEEVLVVAMGDDDIGYGTYLIHFNGSNWSEWIALNGSMVQDRYVHPKLAVDGNGVAHIVWRDRIDSVSTIIYRSYDGTLGTLLDLSAGAPEPGGIEDGVDITAWDDEVLVTWVCSTPSPGVYFRHFNGRFWEDVGTVQLGAAMYPSIDTDGEEVWLTWISNFDGMDSVRCSRYQNGTWQSPVNVSDPDVRTSLTEVDIDVSSGKVHIAWRTVDSYLFYVHQRSFDGRQWGNLTIFNSSTPSIRVYNPSISGEGYNVFLAWQDQRDGSQDIYMRSNNGTGWVDDEQISPEINESSCHDAQVSTEDGFLHVTWCWWNHTHREIYYRRGRFSNDFPSSQLLGPSLVWSTTDEPIEVRWKASDDMGLHSVKLMYRSSPDNYLWTEWSTYWTSDVIGTTESHGTIPFTPPDGDGFYEVCVIARDVSMVDELEKPKVEVTIILDTTPPNGTVTINGGASWSISQLVTLEVTASDDITDHFYDSYGILAYQMRMSNDNKTWTDWKPLEGVTNWLLTNGDGLKTVHIQLKDVSFHPSAILTATIGLDTQQPTAGLIINEGAIWTSSRVVECAITLHDATSGIDAYKISADLSGLNHAQWQAPTDSLTWTLDIDDGEKTLFIVARDRAGKVSEVSSDTIIQDTKVPTGHIALGDGNEFSAVTTVNVTVEFADDGSGVDLIRLCTDGTWDDEPWIDPVERTTIKFPETSGFYIAYLQVKDLAGHVSMTYTDTIMLDVGPPSGTIAIAEGALLINSHQVQIALSFDDDISGTARIRLSNDGKLDPDDWVDPVSKMNWTLSEGDGEKSVFYQIIDLAGHLSEIYEDSVIVDSTPPVVEDAIPGDSDVLEGREFTVHVIFSEPMDRPTLESAFLLSERPPGGALTRVDGTFDWSEDGLQLDFKPQKTPMWDRQYFLEIGVDAKDFAGNGLAIPYTISFRTGTDEVPMETAGWEVGYWIVVLLIIVVVVVGALILRTRRRPRRPDAGGVS